MTAELVVLNLPDGTLRASRSRDPDEGRPRARALLHEALAGHAAKLPLTPDDWRLTASVDGDLLRFALWPAEKAKTWATLFGRSRRPEALRPGAWWASCICARANDEATKAGPSSRPLAAPWLVVDRRNWRRERTSCELTDIAGEHPELAALLLWRDGRAGETWAYLDGAAEAIAWAWVEG